MFNFEGNARALNAVNTLSLHSTNPGTGLTVAPGTELTDTPYSRKAAVFNAPVADGTSAESILNADVTFNLNLTIDQNVQFIGLWQDNVYLGYMIPQTPFNFTGTATNRQYVVQAGTKIVQSNA